MTTITFPTNTKEIIDGIRGAIGREITFYTEVDTLCTASGCSLDPVTNTSVNAFCPVCSGEGYVHTYTEVTVSAHVTWDPSDLMQWASGGQYFEGDCRVQVEYTVTNLEAVKHCSYVIVDTKKMRVNKHMLRGVKDINRILVDLIEEER